MNFDWSLHWLPAISSTSLLALVIWLLRGVISERLKNSIKHEYDEKLEILKSEVNQNEEIFKAEIKRKESQIEALRSGALSGVVNRQAALYQRKLKAVENLWKAVITLAPAKHISNIMCYIKFDIAADEAIKNENVREMFKMLDGGLDIKKLDTNDASLSRPFLSPLVWAYYSAYQSILINAVIKIQALKSGLKKELINDQHATDLVKTALPEYESYIDEYGPSAYHHLLDTLEKKILEELNKILNGEESDQESIEKAAKILKESEKLMESTKNIEDDF